MFGGGRRGTGVPEIADAVEALPLSVQVLDPAVNM
jgi:hypothetical protein